MNRTFRAALRAAGTVAVAGGLMATTALPAGASTHKTSSGPDNLAYGARAAGPITAGPLGLAESPPPQTTIERNVNIPGLLMTGLAFETAGSTSAYARVQNVNTSADSVAIRAVQVASTCRTESFGNIGYANIVGGTLTYPGVTGGVIHLPEHPAPDTVIPVPGGEVVLNRHTTNADGSTIKVEAVYFAINGQDLSLGGSVCTETGTGGIVNGGFETGDFFGWSTSGPNTQVVDSGLQHSGIYSALAGEIGTETDGSSDISQTFIADGTTLSFWYNLTCQDFLPFDYASATLVDETTGTTSTPLAPTCVNASGWTQVTSSLTPGDVYTLTLTNHDDGFVGSDPTWTFFDDVSIF